MTSKLILDNLAGRTTAGSISVVAEGNGTTTNLQQGLCKSWINFDGSGTVSTNDSFNISTLTDNAVGENTTTYTNSFGSANYTGTGLPKRETSTAYPNMANIDGTVTASAMKIIYTKFDNGARTDSDLITQTFHGDLA